MATGKAISDWREDKSLPKCMLYMLENEIMCDVTMVVGESKTKIKAHKYMLSSRSPVFHTMFEGSLAEKGEIIIPDIREDTFRSLIRFVYTDKISITESSVQDLFYASDKYMIWYLKKRCEQFLKEIGTSDHAVAALDTALKYQLHDLRKESMVYIEQNAQNCLSCKLDIHISEESIEMLLKSGFLDCSEKYVCKFFLQWITAECTKNSREPSGDNLREIAGNLLQLVRFPVVDMQYFSNSIVTSGILSSEEIINVFQSHFNWKGNSLFERNPRCPISKRKVYTVTRNSGTKYTIFNPREIQSLTLQSDTNIWLKAVEVFIPVNNGLFIRSSNEAKFRIYDKNDDVVVTHSLTIDNNTTGNKFEIKLPTAVEINAREDYTITFQVSEKHSKTGLIAGAHCKTLVEEAENGVEITFKNSCKDTSGTNTDSGQFSSFSFSV